MRRLLIRVHARPRGARARAIRCLQRGGDLFHRVTLDDVALLEVLEPGEADPALEVLGDLADVVAEAAERLDPVVGDDLLAAAPDARATADDPPVGDEAARDRRALADPEELPDLGAALDEAARVLQAEVENVHRSYKREIVPYVAPGSEIVIRRRRAR